MADNYNGDSFWKETCIHVVDVFWTCFIISPMTIFYWGGTWKLMDLYVHPDDDFYSAVISLAAGTVGCLAGYLLLPLLDHFHPDSSPTLGPSRGTSVRHVLVSRTCIYLLALSVLNYWRGIWNLSDMYLGKDVLWSWVWLGGSGVVLLLLRALGNVVSAPFAIDLDCIRNVYWPTTRFKAEPQHFWRYLGDSLLSHLVITHLSIQVWRVLWNLMEKAILPDDVIMSYCVSLGAGFGGAFILFILQHPLAVTAARLKQIHWLLMLLLQEVVHIAGILVTLLVWRGGWGLNRDYILNTPLEAGLAHGVASVGLLLLQALMSVSTLNVNVDADGRSTDGFYYDVNYFWYFWKQRTPDTIQIQGDRESVSRGLLEESDDDLLSPS